MNSEDYTVFLFLLAKVTLNFITVCHVTGVNFVICNTQGKL